MPKHYGLTVARSVVEAELKEQVRYWKQGHAEACTQRYRLERKVYNYRVLCALLAVALAYALFALGTS
jgi:hypothetical protein